MNLFSGGGDDRQQLGVRDADTLVAPFGDGAPPGIAWPPANATLTRPTWRQAEED